MTPNKENIRKWVDALRSGKYEQCTDALRKGDSFCCLGVACDVAIKNGLKLKLKESHYEPGAFIYEDTDSTLPWAVRDWLGVEVRDPVLVVTEDDEVAATTLNDDRGYTFAQIADLIEEKYLR